MTEEQIARLSANEAACYRWPDDTKEHKALRKAFMDGAAHTVVHSPPIEGMISGPYKYDGDLEPMWCVKHRDGWCAAKPNKKFAEAATSIATKCGYWIALPWGCELRFPTCEQCQAVTNTGPLALECT